MMNLVRRARSGGDDRGIALVMVMGVTAIMAVMLVAAIAYGIGAMRKSSGDQQWNAALAAAYAGIEEYESRLANDTGYWTFGNPAATFSAGSSLILPTGVATNPAFGLGASGTWATVAGSAGKSQFRYEVDSSKFYSDGTLRLRSTGKVGQETRTITADLKQLGFINFLYFTDYEVMDPTAINPTSTTNCAIHEYEGSRSGCSPIYFGGVDTINGPLHTNDTLQTNGAAKFKGHVTTSYKAASGPNYKSSGSAPTFAYPSDPQYVASIGMPATNSELKKETRTDLMASSVPVPGCMYTGPTSITFTSDGKMTVISPWTKYTNTGNAAGTVGSNQAKCGTPGDTGLAKRSGTTYVGQTLAVPANTVFYVQNVPTVSTNVNYTASTTRPPFPATGGTDCPTNGNSVGFPTATEKVPFVGAYGCRNGDLFVKGALKGNLTIAAENYIYATGDLTYADSTRDMLGLVGNNAVFVWNPVNSSNKTILTDSKRTINAAILSVSHTFMVQNYDLGSPRGTLSVLGAIAQKYRGPVGTSSGGSMSTGYAKDYNYDDRFLYTAPPKFLSPVTTTYGVNVWVETRPAFDAEGNYR